MTSTTRKHSAYPRLAGAIFSILALFVLSVVLRADESDFVPGEKQLFYDDFTDMAKGTAPPHWAVRGASVKLTSVGNTSGLEISDDTTLIANLKGISKNFTIESEFAITTKSGYYYENSWNLGTTPDDATCTVTFTLRRDSDDEAPTGHFTLEVGGQELGKVDVNLDPHKPFSLNIWMQDGRARIYADNQRLIDVNQVSLENVNAAWLELKGGKEFPFSLTRVRIAESTPDFSQMLMSSGRYVTHGLHFDTNSDHLKPESTPVLKMIAQALTANPSLKLRIDGHTDSTGNDAHNMDLSKRRAAAVKTALVSNFGIAADRLTTEGMGSTKPLGSNDTPEGRSNNRRVEFVKI